MSLNDDARRALADAQTVDEDLLTPKEYATLSRVHVQTVYTAIRRGRMKFRVVRPTERTIRIVVPRGSILTLSPA